MPAKVVLKFTKGGLKDREFSYDQKECVIIGRQNDSNIVAPPTDTTVSRYHCILDITPPVVTVRDFGSLNGTFLNGQKIGQGDLTKSAEERREGKSEEFPLKHGDRLGLSAECELVMNVVLPQYCADCFCEVDHPEHTNADGQPICPVCHAKAVKRDEAEEAARLAKEKAAQERLEAEKRAKELAAKEQAEKDRAEKERMRKEREAADRLAAEAAEKERKEKERLEKEGKIRQAEAARQAALLEEKKNPKCQVCGIAIPANSPAICVTCRKDPQRLLEFLIREARKGAEAAQQIAGYRNIEMLGKGGMGAVWLVEEIATGRQMAMKLMLPEAAADPKSKAMFLREAYNACQLIHPNIVRHDKCGSYNDIYFILLDYCPGGTVEDYVKRNQNIFDPALNMKPFGKEMSQRIELSSYIIQQTLDGLAYAAQAPIFVKLADGSQKATNGLVHRDLKPGNIFLSDTSLRPVAKIADFGLAKAFQTAGFTEHTFTGQAGGTPCFLPRQQIINYRYANPDVDVWAAAACYYYMLTGYVPKNFSGNKDPFDVALRDPHVPILIRNPRIPKKLAEVVDFALRERPQIGFATAMELKGAINNA